MGFIFKPIIKIVTEVVDEVVEFVDDSKDFVLDDVADPILDTITDVIEDDPVKAIAQVAAVATGQAWALPLIEGADVAQNGGDIGDVLEAAAKVYVAQQVGSMAGEYADTATQTATSSEVAGTIIGSTVGSTASGVILGQDPIEALKTGGVSAAIGASLGQLETNTGYGKLPPSAKAVINAGVTAAVTDGEITPQALTAALVQATVTTNITDKYIKDNPNLSEANQAILTDSILAASKAAFSEGNVTQEVMNAITNQGFKQLTAGLENLVKTGNVKGVKDSYDVLKTTASSITNESASLKDDIAEHNRLINELNPRFTERDRLYNVMESARINDSRDPTVETRTALNNAITAYNNYSKQLNDDYYNNYQSKIADLKFKIDKSKLNITEFENTYEKQYNKLVASADKLDSDTAPIYSTAEKVFTLGMDENFNPDEYASLNNLSEDQDPYYHWLTIGKNDGLHTNAKSYQAEYDQTSLNLATNALAAAGLKITDLNKEQTKFAIDTIQDKYGTDINNLKNADTNELGSIFGKKYVSDVIVSGADVPPDLQVSTVEQINNSSLETIKDVITSALGTVSSAIIPSAQAETDPWDVKKLDVATQTGIAEGNYVEGLDGWKEIQPTLQWDNEYGQVVSKTFQAPTSLLNYNNINGFYTIKDKNGKVLENTEIKSIDNFYKEAGMEIPEASSENFKNTPYANYLTDLGFEVATTPVFGTKEGMFSVYYPNPVSPIPTEDIGIAPQNTNNLTVINPYNTLAGQFTSDPQSAVETASGLSQSLSQDAKDVINEQVGLNVYDFTEALNIYASATQPDVPFAETEIVQNIGTEITQADIDALNTAVAGIQGQESDGVEGADVVQDTTEEQDTTGVGDYLGTIGDYQSQIADLTGQITGLEGTIGEQAGTITGLEGTIGEQAGTITGQQSSISEYLDTISGLQGDISGLEDIKGGLEGQIGELEGEIGGLEGEVEGLEGVIGETGKKQQLFQQVGAMQQLQQLLQPTIVEPIEKGDKTPDIITPYDFSSIFATPEEEERLISPYDRNEELLKLIKEQT